MPNVMKRKAERIHERDLWYLGEKICNIVTMHIIRYFQCLFLAYKIFFAKYYIFKLIARKIYLVKTYCY